MASASGSAKGSSSLVGGDDVVDSGEGAVRVFYLQAKIPEHTEGLRAGHLVDEVGADEVSGSGHWPGCGRSARPKPFRTGFFPWVWLVKVGGSGRGS